MPEPRFHVEERKDCVLVWNERDFALPRRCVASFPNHPHDKHEAMILAGICVAAINRELPGHVAENPDPELDVPPVAATRKPAAPRPVPAAPPAPAAMTPLQIYAGKRLAERKAAGEGTGSLFEVGS